eukprot:PhF_6_TR17341/c0_g1_i2/m.26559
MSEDLESIVEPLQRQLAYFENLSKELVDQIQRQNEEIRSLHERIAGLSQQPPHRSLPHYPSAAPKSRSVSPNTSPTHDQDIPPHLQDIIETIVRRRVRHYVRKMEENMCKIIKERLQQITEETIEVMVSKRLTQQKKSNITEQPKHLTNDDVIPCSMEHRDQFEGIGELEDLLKQLRVEHPDIFR